MLSFFMLKILFVLTMFQFLSRLFGHVRKWLDKKAWLISKCTTSQTYKQIIGTHCPISQKVKANWQ